MTIVYSIEIHNIDVTNDPKITDVQLELIHDQLPLAVPCYDLLLVTELTVGPREVAFRALPAPLS